MNIRIPDTLSTMPSAVQDWPNRIRRTSSRTRLILAIVSVALLAYVAWRIFGGPAAPVRPPPPVQVSRAVQEDVSIVEHTIGTVLANATVQLTARVQGQLFKAYFKEGQIVHAGDLLFQIDPRPYRATYESAMASLAAARAKADRFARLMAQKAIAPQDADDAKAAYLEARATAETARLNLEYTNIRSPIDGKTGPILIQPGNQVAAGTGTSSGVTAAVPSATLVVITQIQPVKVSFALPQADLPRIQDRQRSNGLTAAIDTHGSSGGHLEAAIDFIGNAIDNATGTIELRATYANADSRLVPGQLVDVGVTLNGLKRVTVVPHDAVNLGPNSRYVYVIKNGMAQMRNVKVLYDSGSDVAVQGEIRPGDSVITDGQLRVLPGKPVAIVKPGTGPKPATP